MRKGLQYIKKKYEFRLYEMDIWISVENETYKKLNMIKVRIIKISKYFIFFISYLYFSFVSYERERGFTHIYIVKRNTNIFYFRHSLNTVQYIYI